MYTSCLEDQKILAHIFLHLDLSDLLKIKSVSYSFRDAIMQNEYFFRILCESNCTQEQKDVLSTPLDSMNPWWFPLLYLLKIFKRTDEKEGIGVFRWNEKRYYIGKWTNNLRDGLGIYVFGDGRVYQGEWERGRRHGTGTMWWGFKHPPPPLPLLSPFSPSPSSSSRLLVPHPHPPLVLFDTFPPPPLPHTFPPISSRKEFFQNRKKEHKKIGKYVGMWRANHRAVIGTVAYSSGKIYKGQWKSGRYNGTGTLMNTSGKIIYHGEWFKGERDDW